MIRGTTPTLEFTIPIDTSELAEVFVTLSQYGEIVLDKHIRDCQCEGRVVSLKLSQEETLKLRCSCDTEIQIRVKTLLGDAYASDVFSVKTGRLLKDGVI